MSPAPADELPVDDLISVSQAIKIIDATPVEPRPLRVPLARAQGLRLAENLIADRDYPPFRKSVMDGYAVCCEDVSTVPAELMCVGEVPAGGSAAKGIGPGEAMAIMTGAPLPAGADGIVPVEDVEKRVPVGQRVRILRATTPGRYIAQRGSDCPAGAVVLSRGTLFGAPQIAVAASVGASRPLVFARPRVAVLGTGDELVPIDSTPGGSHIRNSNNPMLVALLQKLGCDVTDLGPVKDQPALIRAAVEQGLQFDALFITGGMSMGEYDFVPRILLELGVELKITKLRIKPGKPFVFGEWRRGQRLEVRGQVSEVRSQESGVRGQGVRSQESGVRSQGWDSAAQTSNQPQSPPDLRPLTSDLFNDLPTHNPQPTINNKQTFIFGLPGNPVSAYVCALRFASRLLTRMAGGSIEERWLTGKLDAGLPANGPREFYLPAIRTVAPGSHSAQSEFANIHPLGWVGSADLFTLAKANVLLVRAENEPALPKGTVVRGLEM